MKIKIKDEEELVKTCEEALHILSNLRKFTKLWETHYGSTLKNQKKNFEKKADLLIERLKVEDHKHPHEVNIQLNADRL